MSNVEIMLNIFSHLIPVVLTAAILFVGVALMVGSPYCHYVNLVSDATDEGKENLAKYLARRAGGRKIDNNQSWRSFIPAAKDLHKKHVNKKNNQ